jgi:hypothetical protein
MCRRRGQAFLLWREKMSGLQLTTFDLSGFFCVPQSVRVEYQMDWNTFERIQGFNINVSTLRHAGDKTLTYYQFLNGDERTSFANGQSLHVRRYPNSNWNSVSPD